MTRRKNDNAADFADKLQDALIVAAAAHVIATPSAPPPLLESIVRTAMHVTAAESGALFLTDEPAQELEFKVALGPHSAATRVLRVPMGHGIAGRVALSGKPMIVPEAATDPRRAADIAQAVGYTPENILCAPLLRNDRVIGVLEMLDKKGAPFTPADLATLRLLAEQAAVAIEQSLAIGNVAELLAATLGELARGAAKHTDVELGARGVARRLDNNPLYGRTLALAALVREIAGAGEAELAFCESTLRGLAHYLRSRPGTPR